MSLILQTRLEALEAGVANSIGLNSGDFKVSDYDGDAGAALTAALAISSSVVILPGTYSIDSPIDLTTAGIQIFGFGNPVLVINHTGPVGAINAVLSGDLIVEGVTFRVNNWVPSQKVINVEPVPLSSQTINCQIKNNTFIFGVGTENDFAPTFSAGNEMIGVSITQGAGCEIEKNTFYPNKGVTCAKLSNGIRNICERNKVVNASVYYLPIIQDAQRRPCYIGIDSQGETAPIFHRNVFMNLGLIDADPVRLDRRLAHAIRVQIPNIGKGIIEYGHAVLQNNIFMNCLTDNTCVVDLRGPRWTMVSGGYFCFNGTGAAAGSGFLRITDANADGSGTDAYGHQCQITGVHFHNPGTTNAACILISSCSDLAIQSCVFHELYTTAPIVVNPGTIANNVLRLTITGCKASWPSGSPNNRFLINRLGSTANAAKDLYVGDTPCSSGDSGFLVSGIYNGTIFAGKHGIKGVVVDSTGVDTASDLGTNNIFLGQ